MRVAVAQFLAGEDKAHNLARVGELVGQAAALGATLVVAPEAAMHGFGTPETPLAPIAEPLDGAFVSGLQKCASRHGVTIVAGMFEPVEGDTARAYNPAGAGDRERRLRRGRRPTAAWFRWSRDGRRPVRCRGRVDGGG